MSIIKEPPVSIFEFKMEELAEHIKEADIPAHESAKIFHELDELEEYWKDKDHEAFDTQIEVVRTLLSGAMSKATFPDHVYNALEVLQSLRQQVLGVAWDKGTQAAQKTEFERMLEEQFEIR